MVLIAEVGEFLQAVHARVDAVPQRAHCIGKGLCGMTTGNPEGIVSKLGVVSQELRMRREYIRFSSVKSLFTDAHIGSPSPCFSVSHNAGCNGETAAGVDGINCVQVKREQQSWGCSPYPKLTQKCKNLPIHSLQNWKALY
jgi:hypothetical protein